MEVPAAAVILLAMFQLFLGKNVVKKNSQDYV
jgi:hypothetical protein